MREILAIWDPRFDITSGWRFAIRDLEVLGWRTPSPKCMYISEGLARSYPIGVNEHATKRSGNNWRRTSSSGCYLVCTHCVLLFGASLNRSGRKGLFDIHRTMWITSTVWSNLRLVILGVGLRRPRYVLSSQLVWTSALPSLSEALSCGLSSSYAVVRLKGGKLLGENGLWMRTKRSSKIQSKQLTHKSSSYSSQPQKCVAFGTIFILPPYPPNLIPGREMNSTTPLRSS